jgi:hypothetical protein
VLAVCGAEGASPHVEDPREQRGADRSRGPAAPPAAPAGPFLTLVLWGSRGLAMRALTQRFRRDSTEPRRG